MPPARTAELLNGQPNEPSEAVHGFVRDRLTWTGYLIYGLWSFAWSGVGAFMPMLRTEFDLSLSEAGFHFSALALGPFVSGFIGDRIVACLGLARTAQTGCLLIGAGILCLVFGPNMFFTILGAWLVGFGGSTATQAIITIMSARFGEDRAAGITECQLSGSVFSFLAPVSIVAGITAGLTWRQSMLLFFGLFVLLTTLSLRCFPAGLPGAGATQCEARGRLPSTFWLYFGVVFLSVAAEWSVAFWCPEFLAQVHSLGKADAAVGMSIFLLAMFLGRVAGSHLVRMFSAASLLTFATPLALAGFLVFWLSRNLVWNLAGLFLLGIAEANVYPLALSLAIGACDSANQATARMFLSTGSAICLAPLLLGSLADSIGLTQAYAAVAASLLLAALTVLPSRLTRNRSIR